MSFRKEIASKELKIHNVDTTKVQWVSKVLEKLLENDNKCI